jgi:LuxR family transcriptional regulator, maltose regulon positive regulatory protein
VAALAARTEGWVDPTGAVAAIDEAGHASSGPAGVLDPVPAQRARLLLAQGDLAGAARWAQESGLSPDDEPEYPREAGLLVLARVFLADGQAGRALRLLDRLHAAATAQDRAGSLVELGAVQALALAASGEQAAAMGALAAALVLACLRGHVRVFADEGAPMAALLSRLIAAHRSGGAAAGISHGCLVRLHRAFEVQQAVRRGPAPGAGIIDPLTSREQECCRSWLRAGRTRPSPRSW